MKRVDRKDDVSGACLLSSACVRMATHSYVAEGVVHQASFVVLPE